MEYKKKFLDDNLPDYSLNSIHRKCPIMEFNLFMGHPYGAVRHLAIIFIYVKTFLCGSPTMNL